VTGFSKAVLAQLKVRSGGICEGCRIHRATEAHHRLYRSRGGPDTIENAMHLCGSGNHTGDHGVAHTAVGERRGWSLRSGFEPAEVPVLVAPGPRERWVRFDERGLAVPVLTATALEFMALIGAGTRAGRS